MIDLNMMDMMDKKTILEYNYKTEICNNWKKTGECPYGRCYFAHGNREIMKPGEYNEIKWQKKEAKLLIKKEKRKSLRKAKQSLKNEINSEKSAESAESTDIENDHDSGYITDEHIYNEKIYNRYWNSIHSLILNESSECF
jgi:hypothetical protein